MSREQAVKLISKEQEIRDIIKQSISRLPDDYKYEYWTSGPGEESLKVWRWGSNIDPIILTLPLRFDPSVYDKSDGRRGNQFSFKSFDKAVDKFFSIIGSV